MKKIILALATLALTGFSNAAILSADFTNKGDLPYSVNSTGALVFAATNVTVGAGIEFDAVTPTANPSGWTPGRVAVDINPTTNILTLTARDALDFQTFLFEISNIVLSVGENITGFTLISNNLMEPVYAPTLSFTNNSLNIFFDTGSNTEFDFVTDGQATFQISTSTGQVPAPASLALIAVGLVLMRKKIRA